MNLDALLREEAIDLIVCDVEGAETVLFQGADLSGVDRIFLEMHDHVTGLSGVRGLFATLAGHGFVYDPRHSLGSVVLFQKLGPNDIVRPYAGSSASLRDPGGRHDRRDPASAARSAGASTACRKAPPPATAPPAAATARSGPTTTRASGSASRARPGAYVRGRASSSTSVPTCGCIAFWRGKGLDEQGRRRIAVNLRLAEPEAVAGIAIDHFDGLVSFEDLPRDGRCVADMWF